MPNVNLINIPSVAPLASSDAVRRASVMGLLSSPPPPATFRPQDRAAPVTPLMPIPSLQQAPTTMTRGSKVPAPSRKQLGPPKPTTQYRLPSGQMDEPDVVGAPDEDEANHSKKKKAPMKSKPVTNPSNLGYSQSYDPNGSGYRAINTISPQSAAALRAKFKTPSNLG